MVRLIGAVLDLAPLWRASLDVRAATLVIMDVALEVAVPITAAIAAPFEVTVLLGVTIDVLLLLHQIVTVRSARTCRLRQWQHASSCISYRLVFLQAGHL